MMKRYGFKTKHLKKQNSGYFLLNLFFLLDSVFFLINKDLRVTCKKNFVDFVVLLCIISYFWTQESL